VTSYRPGGRSAASGIERLTRRDIHAAGADRGKWKVAGGGGHIERVDNVDNIVTSLSLTPPDGKLTDFELLGAPGDEVVGSSRRPRRMWPLVRRSAFGEGGSSVALWRRFVTSVRLVGFGHPAAPECVMTRHVEVPWASSFWPPADVSRASAVQIRLPRCTSRPVHVIGPVSSVIAPTRLTFVSKVV
jgi:hypothetical protein